MMKIHSAALEHKAISHFPNLLESRTFQWLKCHRFFLSFKSQFGQKYIIYIYIYINIVLSDERIFFSNLKQHKAFRKNQKVQGQYIKIYIKNIESINSVKPLNTAANQNENQIKPVMRDNLFILVNLFIQKIFKKIDFFF